MSENLLRDQDVKVISNPASSVISGEGSTNSHEVNSEKLPYQYSVTNFGDSKITVDLFYNGDGSLQLKDNVEKFLYKTFEKASKTGYVDEEKDFNVRIFLFDDKGQYASTIKKIDGIDVKEQYNGYTSKNSASGSADIYIYKNLDSSSTNLTENCYFGLIREFFHNLYNNVKFYQYQPDYNTKSMYQVEALEEIFVWQLLKELGYHNRNLEVDFGINLSLGASKIKNKQLALSDIIFSNEKLDYEIDSTAIAFVLERHSQFFVNVIDYFYLKSCEETLQPDNINHIDVIKEPVSKEVAFDDDTVKSLRNYHINQLLDKICKPVDEISGSVEFPYWIANIGDKIIVSNIKEIMQDMKDFIEIGEGKIDDILEKGYNFNVDEEVLDDKEKAPGDDNDYEELDANTTIGKPVESYLKGGINGVENPFEESTNTIQQEDITTATQSQDIFLG